MKIRGTAQHIAEKYLQLARDAQSSGDPVMAESYLQHAEHYFRIIAAAQQAQQQQQMGYRQQADAASDSDDSGDDDDAPEMNDRFAAPAERAQALLNQPQPNLPPSHNPYAGQNRDGGRGEWNQQDRHGQRHNNGHRRPEIAPESPNADAGADDGEDGGAPHLPSFITGAGRASERPEAESEGGEGGGQMRNRRRRRPMPQEAGEDGARGERQRNRNEPEVPAGE